MQILGTDDEPQESAPLLDHHYAASPFVVLLGLCLWCPGHGLTYVRTYFVDIACPFSFSRLNATSFIRA